MPPPWYEAYATQRPSGDHSGSSAIAPIDDRCVRCTGGACSSPGVLIITSPGPVTICPSQYTTPPLDLDHRGTFWARVWPGRKRFGRARVSGRSFLPSALFMR